MKYIGFSLSLCIQDILNGLVKEEDVLHIVTGCSPRNQDDLEEEIIPPYMKSYWRNNPEAVAILRRLDEDRRISWLSAWRKSAPNIGWGHWIDVEKGSVSRAQLKAIKDQNP